MSRSETSSFDREYEALRSGLAVVELVDWSSISVAGADRQPFLHNFCTNDVKRLAPGTSCEAFFTNVKGRIVGHGLIHCRVSELAIVGAPGQGPRLVEHLSRYVIREDVMIRDTTTERSYILVSGERQPEISHEAIAWNMLGRGDTNLHELRPQDVASALDALVVRGFVAVGPRAFEAIRIEAGMPLCDVDFDEHNFPQELGRNSQAISFTKGCYLGQETVARIDALGHVNQGLCGVKFLGTEIPSRGTEISIRGITAGRVTSATFSPRLNAPLALAMVRRESAAPGVKIESSVGECAIVALPATADERPIA